MILANLKTKRDTLMMTQAELAQLSGVTVQTVSNLERNGSASVTTAKKLSKAMRCRVEDLTGTREGCDDRA